MIMHDLRVMQRIFTDFDKSWMITLSLSCYSQIITVFLMMSTFIGD